MLYINDLIDEITCQTRLYADDTCIYIDYNEPDAAAVALEDDLERVLEWADKWFVSFNAKKSKDLTASRKRFVYSPALTMNNTLVPKVNSHKHLGITFQNDGKWKEQTASIVARAKRRNDILRSYMHRLDRKTLEKLYLCYIRPVTEYASVVWDNCSDGEKNDIEEIQREAARIVTGAKKGTSHQFLYDDTHWELLQVRRTRARLLQLFKILKCTVPPTLRALIPTNQSTRGPNARNPHNIPVPPNRTEILHKSFINGTIPLWNKLPNSLKELEDLETFKHKLKALSPKTKTQARFEAGCRKGQILHTRIRSGNCDLNYNLNQINLAPSPECQCGEPEETVTHYLLHCTNYTAQRATLLQEMNGLGITALTKKVLLQGTNELSEDTNSKLFVYIHKFIISTKRFK